MDFALAANRRTLKHQGGYLAVAQTWNLKENRKEAVDLPKWRCKFSLSETWGAKGLHDVLLFSTSGT